MVTKQFLSNVVIMRQPCDYCNGQGKIDHPIWTAYQNGAWISWHVFAAAAGVDGNDRSLREKIECPRCEGVGYSERAYNMETIFNLVLEWILESQNASRIKKQLVLIDRKNKEDPL